MISFKKVLVIVIHTHDGWQIATLHRQTSYLNHYLSVSFNYCELIVFNANDGSRSKKKISCDYRAIICLVSYLKQQLKNSLDTIISLLFRIILNIVVGAFSNGLMF